MKLWKIWIKKPCHYYAIAENSNDAWHKVSIYLEKNDYYFSKDRNLDRIELIADECEYGENVKLFL